MSTADYFVGQMAGEIAFDPRIFDPNPQSLARYPQAYMYDHDGSDQALLYPLSGLPGEHQHGVPFANQLLETEGDVYPFNTGHQYSRTGLSPVFDTASSTLDVNSQTPPWSVLSLERIPNEPKKTSTKPQKKTTTTKQNQSLGKPDRAARKTRIQPKCDASKANDNRTKDLKETKTKNRREGSLERNRVAASKCRNRKKQWAENLREQKSELEAIHTNLQAES